MRTFRDRGIWEKLNNPTMAMAADACDLDLVVERVGAAA
jgi:hypothetical protein